MKQKLNMLQNSFFSFALKGVIHTSYIFVAGATHSQEQHKLFYVWIYLCMFLNVQMCCADDLYVEYNENNNNNNNK